MSNLTLIQMSPCDIQAAIRSLMGAVGGTRADVIVSLNEREGAKPIAVSVYADGMTKGNTFRVEADGWSEAFALAHAKWAEVGERVEGETIERMALEIIRIVHRKGVCTDADIRAANFTEADVQRYGERACEKANAMADEGPFTISTVGKANAA